MRVAKWGNSLAVRLPKSVVDALALKEGDEIAIALHNDRTFLVELDQSRDDALDKLRAFRGKLPKGFSFDRDQANER